MHPVRVRRFLEVAGLMAGMALALACAGPGVRTPAPAESPPIAAGMENKAAATGAPAAVAPSPEDLFFRALVGAGGDEGAGENEALRLRLEIFIQKYPASRWVAPARTLIDTLARLRECERLQEAERREREGDLAEKIRLMQEKETLRQELRLSQEKYQGELNRLTQDNDQLKKYIQRLRDLEIQLEKRDRLLR